MAVNPPRKAPVTLDEAKQLLVEDAPAPIDVWLRDPTAMIRRHPKEAMGIALASGILLIAVPGLRRRIFSTGAELARIFLT